MVWGAFTVNGCLELAFPSTRMNSTEYVEVLQMNLLPLFRRRRARKWVFQQDNAAVHRSRQTLQWLATQNIDVLTWPSCSPDLNPMENLWGIMVRSIYDKNKQFDTIRELKAAVIRAWEQVELSTLENLISSMPNRLFELIQNNGGYTHY